MHTPHSKNKQTNDRSGNPRRLGLKFFGFIGVFIFGTWLLFPQFATSLYTELTAQAHEPSNTPHRTTQEAGNMDAPSTSLAQQISDNTLPLPDLSARSYLVADLKTGEVIAQKNAGTVRPIASITKLMTALVAHDAIGYNRMVPITEEAVATYGKQGDLEAGETMAMGSLLYPLLLESSNDAAEAVARLDDRSTFIARMNQKARNLGMYDTHFDDPSGLSAYNVSSTRDLLRLARHIYYKRNSLFDITATLQETVPEENSIELKNFTNNNPFKTNRDFLGGKNGYTDAARKTLLSLFNVNSGDTDRPLAIIVLGSEEHTKDTRKLLDWFNQSAENVFAHSRSGK